MTKLAHKMREVTLRSIPIRRKKEEEAIQHQRRSIIEHINAQAEYGDNFLTICTGYSYGKPEDHLDWLKSEEFTIATEESTLESGAHVTYYKITW